MQSCWATLRDAFSPATADTLTADKLALIVNRNDLLSQQIATYYQERRQIPDENVIWLEFDSARITLPAAEFAALWREVQRQAPETVQAYALTWAQPYRVDCMSITSAFAFGFHPEHCAQACHPTVVNPYFNSGQPDPYDTFQVRPTIALAAATFADAKALIDRGIAADRSHPVGTAYLMSTDDRSRNVRAQFYPDIQLQLGSVFPIQVIVGNQRRDRSDVMAYFTRLAQVAEIDINQYLPGAVADHLTSFGSQLTDSSQMSTWIGSKPGPPAAMALS